MLYSIK
ncbi:hypothetical protein VCHENC02_4932A, partial [Vibrio harveyi]